MAEYTIEVINKGERKMVELKVLLGIILIAFAITLPFACSSGDWKYWAKTWIIGSQIILLIFIGLKLMGVS